MKTNVLYLVMHLMDLFLLTSNSLGMRRSRGAPRDQAVPSVSGSCQGQWLTKATLGSTFRESVRDIVLPFGLVEKLV